MKVKFFNPYWGSEQIGFEKFLENSLKQGYDGVEVYFPIFEKSSTLQMLKYVEKAGALLISQHGQTYSDDFDRYKNEFEERLYLVSETKPLFINSQTGVDFFSFDQNMELIHIARRIEQDTGVAIVHEMHRGKFPFAAHITKKYLEHDSDIRLCADFSHWTTVAESLLQNQTKNVELAISRADHIHARVGFQEGPQIPDPRTPEWNSTLTVYLTWWDKIIKRAEKEGKDIFTITPEFGPFPYMPILPYTEQPITSQWDVNLYMKGMLANRYN